MRLINADELIEKYGGWYTEEGTEEGFIGTIESLINAIPSVQPERKTGKWISDKYGNVICSACKCYAPKVRYPKTNFCGHCGADMGE